MGSKILHFEPLILDEFLLNAQNDTQYRVYFTQKTYSDMKAETVSDVVSHMKGKTIYKIEKLYCRVPDILTRQKFNPLDRKKK